MTDPEVALLTRMLDRAGMVAAWERGVRAEVFETPIHGAVFGWMVDYWMTNQMAEPPTRAVMEAEFPALALPRDGVDESVAWLIDHLQERYTRNRAQKIILAAAENLADPVEALGRMWRDAYAAAEVVSPRSTRVDLALNVDERRRAYAHREQTPDGVTLGLTHLDAHTRGLLPGELASVVAYTKTGKAQPLTSRVATPHGWVTLGELRVGDQILGSDGGVQYVTGVFDQGDREVWEVQTTSGVVVQACADHLWAVHDRRSAGQAVLTTEEISREVRTAPQDGRPRFLLPVGAPARYEREGAALPLDPYLLGVLLGKAGGALDGLDPGLHLAGVRRRPPDADTVADALRRLGLAGKNGTGRFIPEAYRFSTVADRLLLVQGLMDSGGVCNKRGGVWFRSPSLQLATDFGEVIRSLGGVATLHVRRSSARGNPKHRVRVRLPVDYPPFLNAHHRLDRVRPGRRSPTESISSVRRTGRLTPMRCIAVSNPDRLYRTEGHVLTHNTWLLLNAAVAARRAGHTPLVMTLEQSIGEVADRIDALWSGVSYQRLHDARLSFEESRRLRDAQDELAAAGPLYVEKPQRGERTVRNMCGRARQLGADILIVDQLSFMDGERDYTGDRALTAKHGDIIFDLKDEINRESVGKLPCLLAVQMNRQGGSREGGRGEMYNIANSSMIEQTVDLALGLWRNTEMRNNHAMGLDIMGARRVDLKKYLLRWELTARSLIEVREELADG